MNPYFHKLKNGLTVLLIDTKAFPSLTTLLLVNAGSRYENPQNNGIAHFLEHMFYKGSKKYPNPFIISQTIEGLGGNWNAFTSKDYTGYYIKAASYHFDTIVDLLSDILLNSFFKEEEIVKEKGVIVEEINMYEDQPQSKVGELFENLIYANSPLGMDIIGTKDTVTSFNRNNFIDYMSSLYFPNNAVLIVAGGLSTVSGNKKNPYSYYLDLIEEKFGAWRKGNSIKFQSLKERQTKPQLLVYNKKTEQAHFCLGFRTFGYADKRRYALSVLTTLLGGGASSRLFAEVRERRGLCYYIGSGAQHYHDVGNLVTQAGVPKSADKAKEAIVATLAEHKKVMNGDIKKDEVARAKEMIKGRLLLSMEDSFKVAHYFGKSKLLMNEVKTPEEQISQIDRVTIGELIDLSKDIFKQASLNLSVIGPFEDKNQFESILDI